MADRIQVPEAVFDLEGDPVEVLQTVWKEALDVVEVDPDAGFFDLGATSVIILGVVHVLRERWPHLRVVDIFSHPTVKQLAAFLDDE
ncbi:acyl carrier protein [Micromonospora aurantiaca]|uniref:phosphopantetheine-binding protein n=1 Tax=Micromonospora aurantiaca (nom. illeg.) TaxID=47850 RepID=UPI000F41DBA0|nr:phosphopantetheine-binding protein [Micromonospora aurantiaca]RNH93524.1 acyl carrier protein [Micromonospora aurantiaca]